MAKVTSELVLKISGVSKSAVKSINGTVKSINKFQKSTKAASKSLSDLSRRSVIGFAAVSAGIAGTIIPFSRFETGIANVSTLLSGTDEEIRNMNESLEKLAKDTLSSTAFAIEDVTKAMFDMVSAGVSVADSQKFLKAASDLAVGGVTRLGVAVDGITSVMNAYKEENLQATEVASAFFTAQKFGKTTVEDLASGIGKILPVAKAAGFGFDEMLAATSQLTLGGISTDEAITALRGAMSGLLGPTETAAKKLTDLGIPFGQSGLKGREFGEVLGFIQKAIKSGDAELIQLIPNIRAFTAVSALGSKELENYDSILKEVRTDTSSLNRAVEIQNATFTQSFGRFQNSIKLLAIELGEKFAPTILKATDALQPLIVAISKMDPSTLQAIATAILAIAVSLGTIAVITKVGALVLNFVSIMATFRKGLLLTSVRMQTFKLGFIATNPVLTAIVVAVTAVSVVLAIMSKRFGGINNALKVLGNEGAKVFQMLGIFAVAAWDVVKGLLKSLFDFVGGIFTNIKMIGAMILAAVTGNFSKVNELANKFAENLQASNEKINDDTTSSNEETKGIFAKAYEDVQANNKRLEEGLRLERAKTVEEVKEGNLITVSDFTKMNERLKALGDETSALFVGPKLPNEEIKQSFGEMFRDYTQTLSAMDKGTKEFSDAQINQFKRFEETFKLGGQLAEDFQGTITTKLQDVFTSSEGAFAKTVGAGLTGLLGPAGSLIGGAAGGIIAKGIGSLVGGILGGSGTKSVQEFAEEAFEKMVRNTNRALQNIGEERTRIEKQVDLLDELQRSLDPLAEIPAQFTKTLEVDVGTTIQEGLVQLFERLKGQNQAATAVFTDQLKAVSERREILDLQRRVFEADQKVSDALKPLLEEARQKGLQAFTGADRDKIFSEISKVAGVDVARTALGNIGDSVQAILDKAVIAFTKQETGAESRIGAGLDVDKEARNRTFGEFQAVAKRMQELQSQLADASQFTIEQSLDSAQLTNRIAGLLGDVPEFQQGAINVPKKTLAIVDPGEMIIPKPFADGIRENTTTLGGTGEQNVMVTNNNNIEIMGTDKTGEQIFNEIKPFFQADFIQDQRGSLNGVFQ